MPVSRLATIGAAIVGTGFMGWVHAEALRRLGVRLVGVLGSSDAKSKSAAEQYGAQKAYASCAELLADDEVQVVHVNTPNHLHASMAEAALEAGKHVLCEKPLAMSSEESSRLLDVSGRHPQLVAGVNYNIRFYPLCLEARARIATGELGEVFHVSGSYVQDWLLKPTDYNWRVLADQGGELRAVADIGTHWLDLVQFVTGRHVTEVCADLKTVHPQRRRPKGEVETFSGKKPTEADTEPVEITTEDYGHVLLRFGAGEGDRAGGARGAMGVSQVNAGRKNCLRFEVAGASRALAWNSEEPNALWIGERDSANQSLLRDPAALSPSAAAFANYPGGHNEGFDDTFKQGFRAFYGAILAGKPTLAREAGYATFGDGHREILLCEAIASSARAERWVKIGKEQDL